MTASGNLLTLLAVLSLSGIPLSSYAQLPVDPSVMHGNVTIDTVGSHMTVTNSPHAIINWQSFSIGANESVHFQQQNAASQVLNRVSGHDPSQIFGQLSSNGGVWLINPHGVLFGQNARIDVAGLVASTLDISNLDFMASRYRFNTTTGIGEIRNQGEIRTTFGGRVWLAGNRVYNEGLVETPGGNVVLAAGKSIELIDSGAPNVVVRVKAPENEAVNLGSLVASSGNVDLHGSIVNQAGIIRADSISTDTTGRIILKADQVNLATGSETQAEQGSLLLEAETTLNNRGKISGHEVSLAANEILQQGRVQARGGKVTLTAGASTYLEGVIDVSDPQDRAGDIQLATHKLEGRVGGALRADGTQGGNIRVEGQGLVAFSSALTATGKTQGGQIEVTGDQVLLLNAEIDATGNTQGGSVHLGGGWQGGGDLPHARTVLIDADSVVKASGSSDADTGGGEIAVWSTQSSEHYGLLQAGGAGRIEFSSKGVIRPDGYLEAGAGGTLLFDPKNLVIIDDDREFPSHRFIENETLFGIPFDAYPGETSYISPHILTWYLAGGTAVTLQADNDITVQSPVDVNDSSFGGHLTLQAGRHVTFNANITIDSGDLTVVAGDPGANALFTDPGTPLLTIEENVSLNAGSGTTTLAVVGGNFINRSGDSAILTAASVEDEGPPGRWLIYATDPASSLKGFGSEGSPHYSKRYDQPFMPGVVPEGADEGNWFFYSIAPVLSVRPSNETMTYGDDRPDFTPTFSGFIDGDTQRSAEIEGRAGWTISGPFSSTELPVRGSHDVSYERGFISALGYRFADDASSVNELTVNARGVTVENFTANNKTYDGTTTATVSTGTLSGVIEGDAVFLGGRGIFDNKNAGDGITVKLAPNALTGADSGNYVLSEIPQTRANITRRGISLDSAHAEKIYDGTVNTRVSGTLAGTITGDSVSFAGSGVFDDKHVGSDKKVTLTGGLLTGADEANYYLDLGNIAFVTGDIFPRPLMATGFRAADKKYDGNTTAQLISDSGSLTGVIAGDSVFVSSGTGAFEDKQAGRDKPVIINDVVLAGVDSGNYVLDNILVPRANIRPLKISLESIIHQEKKTYDGTVDTSVGGTLAGTITGDSVSFAGSGVFDDKHVGSNKKVILTGGSLTGTDAANYKLGLIRFEDWSTTADIFPKLLTIADLSAVKEYDGNTLAKIGGRLIGTIAGDLVFLVGTGNFEDANVGSNKRVTVNNIFLKGVESSNYTLDPSIDFAARGTITPATLTYRADHMTRLTERQIAGLSGTVTGFVEGESLENATAGKLVWMTPATEASPGGIYPIYGSGLSAGNYEFIQAKANDHALALQVFDNSDTAFRQETIDTSVQSLNVAMSGTRAMLDTVVGGGRAIDMIASLTPFMMTGFGRLSITNMSRENMQWLVGYRKAFKEKLFADAIARLELDPDLADVPMCSNLAEINSGSCRISYERYKALQSDSVKNQLPDSQPEQKEEQKEGQGAKIATLPQIKRKFAVLFGIDRYTDRTIPLLENAISDAEAVGQLFTGKLGYETHIVSNATRADIVRTFNQLAMEMRPDDSLVVYYAGHGYLNEKTGGGYWIPSDAFAKDPTGWLSNVSISEMLAGIRSKQIVMISDSCYSGTFTRERKIGADSEIIDPTDILAKRSVIAMSSGGDEPVADEGRNGHSIFAWYLMQALYDVDRWQAGYNIFEEVQREVKRSFPQTPQYGAITSAGHEEGDYLFEFRQLKNVQ